MKILGIDPAKNSGIALIEGDKDRAKILSSGETKISWQRHHKHFHALDNYVQIIQQLVTTYGIDKVVIEHPFLVIKDGETRNRPGYDTQMEIFSLWKTAVAMFAIPILAVYPTTWMNQIGANTRKGEVKDQVRAIIQQHFQVDLSKLKYDESDAIGIAYWDYCTTPILPPKKKLKPGSSFEGRQDRIRNILANSKANTLRRI